MGLIHKCKQGLFLLLHRDRQWPGYLVDLQYDEDQPPLLPEAFEAYPDDSTVLSLRLVPEYFKYQVDKEKTRVRRIGQHNWGYAINLAHVESCSEYLSKQFKSSARKGILRYIKRLEHCFEINYQLHFGSVERDRYEFLMNHLHQMITTRFDLKGEQHKELPYWDQIRQNTYDQILKNEASLFVIYHKEQPIEISLNYHLGKMLFSSISSFDMDYAKFGLGHIEIYKQLEWCIENGYILYDMGVGGTDYKRRWSNYIYRFEHHVLYSRSRRNIRFPAWFEINRVRLKEFVKSMGINEIPQKLQWFKNNAVPENSAGTSPIQRITEENPLVAERLKEFSQDSQIYQKIKKQLNNFLYSTQEREEDISVWKTTEKDFIIEGKNHYQILKIND